jgi:predicted unusual protein kinase regulating ubiquinone biosynthesis (AarF/ABC1/UbiB family)
MSNLTLSIDDAILRKARKRAIDRNVSLTELVRGYLNRLAAEEDLQREATAAELLHAFERADVVVGPRRWTRENLHER